MASFVALLRGINVGGNKIVSMKKLVTLFESMGCTNVRTYINSGNVLFDTKKKDTQKLCSEIERAFSEEFKFTSNILLRSKEEIRVLCKQIPQKLMNDAVQRTDVLFLWPKFDTKESLSLVTIKLGVDTVKYFPGAIVWNIDRAKYAQSGMHKLIGSTLYKNTTIRNINTLRKINELFN